VVFSIDAISSDDRIGRAVRSTDGDWLVPFVLGIRVGAIVGLRVSCTLGPLVVLGRFMGSYVLDPTYLDWPDDRPH